MGLCWYCYWGWPKAVADIYDRALSDLDGDMCPLDFGPGHIVWSDENFGSAEWYLEHFEEYKGDYSEEDLAIVKRSLEELAKLPLNVRCIEPDDYADSDEEHPELFPPPKGVEMVGG